MRSIHILRTIARKEFVAVLRSKALHVSAAVLAGLFLTAALVGTRAHLRQKHERERYQELVRLQWLGQPDRHPHRVAHFGDFAFRPASALGFFDFGVGSFTGSSVFLEPHKQNAANFSEARHSTSMLRFGELTMAMTLQFLVPLLIFFVCFSACTGERENGTLPILLCQGVSSREILFGKILGGGVAVAAALAPILAAAAGLLLLQSGIPATKDAAVRAALLASAYAAYFAVLVAVAVFVSAMNRDSRGALLSLLSLWVFLFVLVPRALPNAAKRVFPAPSKPEFDARLHAEAAAGGDGHNPNDPKFEEMKKRVLGQYGAAKLDDVPVNFRGMVMKAGEAHSSRVFQKHFTDLQEIYKNQNRVSEWASWLDPYLAIRGLSMALTGTDYYHFADFQQRAEAFRFDFIDRLNELQIKEVSFATDKASRLDRGHWKEFPRFEYRTPGVRWALANNPAAAFGLAVWALALAWLGLRLPLRTQ
ncbi:MAG: DUF3526 domain-containing protein [Proteobacteria bacterium]|nr:DUF3526 domain-containing protein [Pseudomonadota bacterium]